MMAHRSSVAKRCLPVILFLTWSMSVVGKDDELAGASHIDTNICNCTFETDNKTYSCVCTGNEISEVPEDLVSNLYISNMKLKFERTAIKVLSDRSLTPYDDVLKELYLVDNYELETLGPRIFHDTKKLKKIYIKGARKLTSIDREVFITHLPELTHIYILHCGLIALPYLGRLTSEKILKTVDFENNNINIIETASVKIRSEDLILNWNHIRKIESMAFNGSSISKLSLKHNNALTEIDADAFVGLSNIIDLDLSSTSLKKLPTNGLKDLQYLKILNTPTLEKFPSKYYFEQLINAKLTHSCHCCAFKYPERHDPEMYRKNQELFNKMRENCTSNKTPVAVNEGTTTVSSKFGIIHLPVSSSNQNDIPDYCGELGKVENLVCRPEPDAFNPCEDIMGYSSLRIAVWLVVILAILGNLAVIVVLAFSKIDMQKFLMCNLAFADLCMGIYLALIAVMDLHSIEEYFNYAIYWQNGWGCKVAGFLSVFSTELSIFTLIIITGERWYTITNAVRKKRIEFKTSIKIMTVGWIYAGIMASLPLLGISGYSKTSICLPLTNENLTDLGYLIILLTFNGLAFLAIVFSYCHMWTSIKCSRVKSTSSGRSDVRIAKRMALLVFTDFACWAPMAFFAVTALAGRPLISVTQTKVLLVFIYPINSLANPYLYALLTRQYRKDLFNFLARLGLCDKAALDRSSTRGIISGKRTLSKDKSNGDSKSKSNGDSAPINMNSCRDDTPKNSCPAGEQVHGDDNDESSPAITQL